MTALGKSAKQAAEQLAVTTSSQRDAALRAAAATIRERSDVILQANEKDMQAASDAGLTGALLDRLLLDHERVEAMAAGIEAVAALDDPLGRVLAEWQRPNGLLIKKVSVPLGVIGIIYESRPNVTADAAALCVKSGNAVILRGGSESYHSSRAIYECLRAGLETAGICADCVQMVPTTDRAAVGFLLSSMGEWLDVVVPRGGKNLIRRVQDEARVPVIGHLEGICHVYLHTAANVDMAREITLNAKMRRTGICGAAETLLIDEAAVSRLLPAVAGALQAAGCRIVGDERVCEILPDATPASDQDWSTEYLDAVISVRVVADLEGAVSHIRQFGSGHTECIVTDDEQAAAAFFLSVDSAILLHNASTQFADGGEFGMGAEIGISTDKMHARGPVGVEQLTSFKYQVVGTGQTRPS